MTTGVFRYIDPASLVDLESGAWTKVDSDVTSYRRAELRRSVTDIRTSQVNFGIDTTGFAVHHSPTPEIDFTNDTEVQKSYYAHIDHLLRQKISGIKKVIIFDHTIRRREKTSPRQPVQQVHVDQTFRAAEWRVRRHAPPGEVDGLVEGRYQIINVWRPIAHAATDFPLAVIDWSTTEPDDLVKVDLLYPQATNQDGSGRGNEVCPDPQSAQSTEGYEVKGEQWAILPNERHKFYYMRDMMPDEAMLIKCFDSRSQGQPGGIDGIAGWAPHSAFEDPMTPENARGRESIEVRCLVFYS